MRTYGAAIALTSALVLPLSASAVTIDELKAQVAALMARISEMQTQTRVADPSSSQSSRMMPDTSRSVCSYLNRNLSLGSRGDDVRSLQEFLQSNGYLSAQATGYFGSLTRAALKTWQGTQGLSAIGSMGPLTRAKLGVWCKNKVDLVATPSSGAAPLSVTFSTMLSGFRIPSVTYILDYGDGVQEKPADCLAPADACIEPGKNTHTYSGTGVYTATLSMITNPCAGMELTCKAAIHTEVVAQTVIKVGTDGPVACTMDYNPVCAAKQVTCIRAPCNPIPTTYSNKCAMTADNAAYLYQGACKDPSYDPASDAQCKSWFDGCNTCSRSSPGGMAACTLMYCENPQTRYCKATFTDNQPPTVSSFSGPTVLAQNQSGTWTISASDPENGQLTYQVWWGDENVPTPANAPSALSAREFTQTTTFSHSYATPGTYTVSMVVRDIVGQETKTTTTVQVSGATACATIYQPVCARPSGCLNTCAPGMYCTMQCMLATPVTYGNSCEMNRVSATYLHDGQCTSGDY